MNSKVLVFDGVCVICSRWVGFVLKHDPSGVFKFAAMQSPSGRGLLIEHGIDPDDPMSFLLLEDNIGYTDSDAILRVLKSFGGGWRVLSAILRVIPKFFLDRAYRWLARNRYRLFGRRETCMVPNPAAADRFIQ